jgi:uncharacterized protein YfaS (alpha-2-macroglobulin family)
MRSRSLWVLLVLCGLLASRAEVGATDPFEVQILGQTTWAAGGPASLRVVAWRPGQGPDLTGPVAGVPVTLTLTPAESDNPRPTTLARGRTNPGGTYDACFDIPEDWEGNYRLRVRLGEGARAQEHEASVRIQKEARLFLTSDKPLYQPGQTVHLRCLALRHPSLTPVTAPLVLEIEDPKGNKVFKQRLTPSRFGVSAATFQLASELNLGEYRIKARLEGEGRATAEKSFTVSRYVLPKFKISLRTDKDWYLAGEPLSGTVQADYFFGKPVAGARVTLTLSTFDVASREIARLEGRTDASGSWRFQSQVPDYLTGTPLEQGRGTLALEASLTDQAHQSQTLAATVPVAASPISVEVYPEGDSLAPGLENRLYVLTSYPDGKPCRATVRARLEDPSGAVQEARTRTDDTGFGELTFQLAPEPAVARQYRYSPAPATQVSLLVEARDERGNRAEKATTASRREQTESLILRPEKALYRVGELLRAQVLSTRQQGTVYVDLLRDNQTVLTRSLRLTGGRGLLEVPLTADLYGQVTLHAYMITGGTDTVRDTRKLFIQPARDLVVEVSAGRDTFRPGQEATLQFLVKTPDGRPRAAVLGVDVVDESLFALAERRPGLERVYFLLERELLEPRYEIHGFSLAQAGDPETLRRPQEQNLARVLMTELPTPQQPYTLVVDTFQTRLAEMPGRFQAVAQALQRYSSGHGYPARSVQELMAAGLLSATDSRDAWGRPFELGAPARGRPRVLSRGPDGVLGTADDLDVDQARALLYRGSPAQFWKDGGLVLAESAAMAPGAAGVGPLANRALPRPAAQAPEPSSGVGGSTPPRVRQWFPETLFTRPDLVTDEEGRATLTLPMADSITTWRLSAFASSARGEMGHATRPLRVFQDFFVDLDLPVALTQNDRISVPVAVYNYLAEPQTVTLRLEPGDWFTLEGAASQTLKLGPNEVTGVRFPITVRGLGDHAFTVTARGSRLSDAVRKPVRVLPDGKEFTFSRSDRLTGRVETSIPVPSESIPGSGKLVVTLYPGIFSQLVQGLEAILRMPGGCFEQTSSSTYPNVLVLDYLQRTGRASPEIRMKAEGYINQGYQRLLTFEVQKGGFSVFGQAPANPILTAYGLMEFADMARVHPVDPNLLARTRAWLIAQQRQDGSWPAGREGFYAEGWQNVPNSALTSTAYITWALLETGEKGPAVGKAVAYLRSHLKEAVDPYMLALVANALMAYDPRDPVAARALEMLLAVRREEKDVAWWQPRIATASFGTGGSADVETTALAALALLGSDRHQATAHKALTWLVRSKDSSGTWSSTQATVLALKALLASVDRAGDKTDATVEVVLNGQKVQTVRMTSEDFDVLRQIDLSGRLRHGKENTLVLNFQGQGNCLYQVSETWYVPWKRLPAPGRPQALDLSVHYDRTRLKVDDTARATVRATNLTDRRANMVMLDIGLPPGFDVVTEDLTAMVQAGTLARYSVAARQVILYLEGIDPGATFTASYRVRARFPLRAQAPESRVYEYYNPDREAPVLLTVE